MSFLALRARRAPLRREHARAEGDERLAALRGRQPAPDDGLRRTETGSATGRSSASGSIGRRRCGSTSCGPTRCTRAARRRRSGATTKRFRAGPQQIVWRPARGTEPRTYVLRLTVGRRVYMDWPGKRREAPVVRIQGIEAEFPRRSYAPGEEADLRISTDAPVAALQVFYYSSQAIRRGKRPQDRGHGDDEPGPGRLANSSRRSGGAARGARGELAERALLPAAERAGRAGRLRAVRRHEARRRRRRVAVVLSTNTWQAYNFWDANGDGWGDSWYVSGATRTIDLARPFLDFGVPYRFRDWDLDFIAWLNRTGKHVDFLTDDDLEAYPTGDELARGVRPRRLPRPCRVRDRARVRRRPALPERRRQPHVPVGEQLLLEGAARRPVPDEGGAVAEPRAARGGARRRAVHRGRLRRAAGRVRRATAPRGRSRAPGSRTAAGSGSTGSRSTPARRSRLRGRSCSRRFRT